MKAIEKIRAAGIVGCGGAGFPTHIKYSGEAQWIIINAVECEPLLRTDRYIMRHNAKEIIAAAEILGKEMKAEHVVIATKAEYEKEIKALEDAIDDLRSNIRIHRLKSFYPAGDEQILVYEVTGKVVQPGGIPKEAGAVVSNVGTVYEISEALKGRAFTHKLFTVTGDVEKPLIVKAPLGTELLSCIKESVPYREGFSFITGGPMMGKVRTFDEAETQVVTKTTSGIIVLPVRSKLEKGSELKISEMLLRAKSSCIQCSFCTELCSRHLMGHPLMPHKIMRKIAFCSDVEDILKEDDVKNAMICSECGICEEYACPMGLQPRKINSMLKRVYRSEGFRFENNSADTGVDPMREYRKIPSRRLAKRLGLEDYYETEIDDIINIDTKIKKVIIPKKQHAGEPAEEVVAEGQKVKCGSLIADCGADRLGARLHASIDGVVSRISKESIEIER
ncbi:MAG TPA: 4Fe-4S dicluster domain-containing protein [Candidatus Copromorpha excrementigallinarum]|uniref:4Fe-4S dicluster domain-containing protein n=1 Tax=Candidatus Allocopromorpha excrementigallinarum TaxID=2840742 RepID=A0A9D1L6J2_9FIRM|nr:4Fe-4S dicluster domain-containing protein [Candidatus Copromorpha excrementigallinarum]